MKETASAQTAYLKAFEGSAFELIQSFRLEKAGVGKRGNSLVYNGENTGQIFTQESLIFQCRFGSFYLLIMDLDCPWEEETTVYVFDQSFQTIAKKHFGLPFGFYLLNVADIRPVNATTLSLHFHDRIPRQLSFEPAKKRIRVTPKNPFV